MEAFAERINTRSVIYLSYRPSYADAMADMELEHYYDESLPYGGCLVLSD